MIPTGASVSGDGLEDIQQPSRTYRLDLTGKRIMGFVDGLDSIRQAVYKILLTERFEHLIYSFDYGSEMKGIVGSPEALLQSDIPRRIREALMQDDRITDVTAFRISFSGDCALIQFTVVSDFGSFQGEVEQNV